MVSDRLGVPLAPGGQHAAFGTHNRLLSLGPDTYLEVIAIDPDARDPGRVRWFGLDDYNDVPRLARWIARSDDLTRDLAHLGADRFGDSLSLVRGEYRWRMAVRPDGRQAFDFMAPALMQWDGPHPAPGLPDHGLRLTALTVSHPADGDLGQLLSPVMSDERLSLTLGPAALTACINTPRGPVML